MEQYAVRRARWASLAVAAAIGAVPLAVPGVAAAAPGTLTPVLDCVVRDSSGQVTAVLGYTNSGDTRTVEVGPRNKITPPKAGDGQQPSHFRSGEHRGVFRLVLGKGQTKWHLESRTLNVDAGGSRACPPSTPLPETGNGTGPAIAIAGAGLLGAVVVRRMSRRARAVGRPLSAGGSDA